MRLAWKLYHSNKKFRSLSTMSSLSDLLHVYGCMCFILVRPYYILLTIPSQSTARNYIIWLVIILTRAFSSTPQTRMTLAHWQLTLVLSALTSFVLYWMNGQCRQGQNLPPGPREYPLIRNLLSMPSTLEWETYAKWGQEYSTCQWWIETLVFCSVIFI